MNSIQIRLAQASDIEALMPLVREFYAHERLLLNEARYLELAQMLVAKPDLGRLVVVEESGGLIGYAVIGFGFSLEFAGRDALLDEFYLREAYRGRGFGTKVVEAIEEICRAQGISAFHLEADYVTARVHEYYTRLGFRDHERHLMTKWLRSPRG